MMMPEASLQEFKICSFYKFFPLSEVEVRDLKDSLRAAAEKLGILGLFILGPEGVNSSFSGTSDSVEAFKLDLFELLPVDDGLVFKDSFASRPAFRDLKIKIRSEIVTLGRPDLLPKGPRRHLSPKEWHEMISEKDVVVIDTRNSYEYETGHFRGAIDPKTREFSEFPTFLDQSGIEKDKKVMIYCTGGIRCEKGILEMEKQGFTNVYQLEGGILNYLKEYPHGHFEGECFVFDYRVAVDQNLNPSEKYRLCPHCGQPASVRIDCIQCGVPEIVCQSCLSREQQFHTCSKNCAHHFRLGHQTTRVHLDAFNKRSPLPEKV
jgi:UPF0176 protein